MPEAAQLGRGGAHPCPPRRPSGSGNCPQQLSPLPLDAPAGSRTCKSRGVDCARLNLSSMPGRKLPLSDFAKLLTIKVAKKSILAQDKHVKQESGFYWKEGRKGTLKGKSEKI